MIRLIVLLLTSLFLFADTDSALKAETEGTFEPVGLMLMLLGLIFMIAEIFVAGFGILGIGGVTAFALGSILYFDADNSVYIPMIIAFCISSLVLFVFVLRSFLSSRSRNVVSGTEDMIGSVAEVLELRKSGYLVRCHGEEWSAKSQSKLKIGDMVEVVDISGLVLKVKPIEE